MSSAEITRTKLEVGLVSPRGYLLDLDFWTIYFVRNLKDTNTVAAIT